MKNFVSVLIVHFLVNSINLLFGQSSFNGVRSDTSNYTGIAAYNYCFTEATKHKIFGNYNLAIDLFLKCIKIKENCAAVYYQLSDIYHIVGENRVALNFARAAYKLDKKNIWYQLNLANMYQYNDKVDSTIYVYRKIVKKSPKYEHLYNLAILYVKEKQYQKSLKILNNLERKYGFNKELILAKYKIFTIQSDNKSAIKVLSEGIKFYPDETRFYGLLAEHYASLRENELADQYYDKLLNIDPENEKGILSLMNYYNSNEEYSKFFELARKYICNEDLSVDCRKEIAILLLNNRKVHDKYPTEIKEIIENLINSETNNLELYSVYIDYFIKTNNLERARDELLQLVDTFKDNYNLWEKLFYVLSSLKDYQLILAKANEAIPFFREKAILYLFEGIAAYQLKEYKVAVRALNTGVGLSENSKVLSLQFYTFLGEVYNATNFFDSSDFYFEKALEIDKQNIFVLNNYSYYLALRREKLEKAEEYIKRCLEIEPANYNYLDTYSWILFRAGLVEQAKEKIEQSILYGGSASREVLEHYAEILVTLKLNEEALKCYRLIKNMGKESPLIRSLLKISD